MISLNTGISSYSTSCKIHLATAGNPPYYVINNHVEVCYDFIKS